MIKLARLALAAGALMLGACSTTQYIMSTKEGRLIVSHGKPYLDEQTGTYTYYDAEGRAATIRKDDIVQVMER